MAKTAEQYTANRQRRTLRNVVTEAAQEQGYRVGQSGSIFGVSKDGTASDATPLADKKHDAHDKNLVKSIQNKLKEKGINVKVGDAVKAAQEHFESELRRGKHGPAARAKETGIEPKAKKAKPQTKPAKVETKPQTKPAKVETKPAKTPKVETKPAKPQTKPAKVEQAKPSKPAKPQTKPAKVETKPAGGGRRRPSALNEAEI